MGIIRKDVDDLTVDLTISIVAYHNYEDIKKTITSIEEYTGNILKQIFVVDNSLPNDKISEFCDFTKKFTDVQYVRSKANVGFGKGHNAVLDRINSRYHAIINPDIILKEDSFSKIISFMENDKTTGMCIPQILDSNGQLQQAYRRELTVFDMFARMFCKKLFPKRMAECTLQNMDYAKPFDVPFAQGCFLVIRTELFKKLQGFDDNFFMYVEDADLSKRVNQISRVRYFPDTFVVHLWEKGSHKNIKLFMHHLKSAVYYFKKWGFRLF